MLWGPPYSEVVSRMSRMRRSAPVPPPLGVAVLRFCDSGHEVEIYLSFLLRKREGAEIQRDSDLLSGCRYWEAASVPFGGGRWTRNVIGQAETRRGWRR